jgi:RNA-directed DNA polymerase
LDKSKKLQRKQKTQYRDQVMEVEVELQGKSKVPSNFMVLPNRESVNEEAFDAIMSKLEKKITDKRLLSLIRNLKIGGTNSVDMQMTIMYMLKVKEQVLE